MALNRNGSPEGSISKKIVTTKGDLITATANAIPSRLAAGSNGDTLVANSAASTGLSWQSSIEAGKNRIINGAMLIDQRNAGAAITVSTGTANYSVDRFAGFGVGADGVYTLQQDSSAPDGFTKSLKATVTTADASLGTTNVYQIRYSIEGSSVTDFNFGSASAKTVTLSFWVRSSLTGTFGGALRNSAANRSYPFSYSISVADTWEKKSITIAGDTTGTWLKDNGIGINISFALGQGTDRLGTAGAWVAANNSGATGQVQVISTLNATWYVTGVQLELGSVATAFSNAGGTIQGELAACQRYYVRFESNANSLFAPIAQGMSTSATVAQHYLALPVPMRIRPTTIAQANLVISDLVNYNLALTNISIAQNTFSTIQIEATSGTGATQYRPSFLRANNSSAAYLEVSAEL
jgi:hypothetical protein